MFTNYETDATAVATETREMAWHLKLITAAPVALVEKLGGVAKEFECFAAADNFARAMKAAPGYRWEAFRHFDRNRDEFYRIELVDEKARHEAACGTGYDEGWAWRLGALKA